MKGHATRSRLPAAALLLPLLPGFVAPASGADVSFEPGAQLYLDYDTNRLLLPGTPEGGSAQLAATLQATRLTELSSLVFDARAARHVYEGRGLPDVDATSLALSGRHALVRGLLHAELSWNRDSAFEAERIASGIPAVDTRQEQRRAGAGFRFAQGERATLDVDANWSEIRYSPVTLPVLRGFRYPSLTLTQAFSFAERSRLSLAVSAAELDPGVPGFETRNQAATLVLRHAFTERASLSASGGITRQQRFGRTATGEVASLGVELQPDDLTRVVFDAARRVLPSGTGQLVTRESLGANISRGLAPAWSLTGGVVAVRNRRLDLGDALVDRYAYVAIDAGLRWRPRPTWEAGLRAYLARGRQVEGGPWESANGVAVTLNWQPRAREGST